MAMQKPNTRVRGLESQDKVTRLALGRVSGHDGGITTRWVLEVKRDRVRVGAEALREDQEIVTVKMDGMGQWDGSLDDDVDPFVELWHFNGEVSGGGWDRAILVDLLEGWVLPLGVEGRAGQSPLEEVGALVRADDGGLSDGLLSRTSVPWNDRDKLLEGLVKAGWCVAVALGSWQAHWAIGVVHDTLDVEVDERSAWLLVVRAHPVIGRGLVGFEDQIITLSDVDDDHVGGVRGDRDEIHGNDLKLVLVDVEDEGGLDGAVEETETVALARLNSHLEARTTYNLRLKILPLVQTVDETSVQSGWAAESVGDKLLWSVEGVHWDMAPVLEGNELLVVVLSSSRAVDDHRTPDTLVGLKTVMRVPPRRSVAGCGPPVCHAVAWSDRALGDG